MKIYITGIGVISAIGNNADENLSALKNSISGIKAIQYLDTVHKDRFLAAEVPFSNEELKLMIPNLENRAPHTRATLLSIIAAREAVLDADLMLDEIENMPIIGANTVGGMDFTEQHYRDYKTTNPYYFTNTHSAGENTKRIADYFGTKAFVTTISTACSSSANAIILGARLIKSGRAKRVLVGGSDALTKFSLNGFSSLMIYDEEVCKPFDANRNGLNLGEAGAFLVLESEEIVGNKKVYAELIGYANHNDAYHTSASSPDGEGAFLAMNSALEMAELSPAQISFIHAHGTATPNNDESESIAIKRVFKSIIPSFASSKSLVGHTLGAAGALNAIFAIMTQENNFIFSNNNFQTLMPEGLIPVKSRIDNQNLDFVMSNAFGFGGNNSTLIFGKKQKGDTDV